MIAGSTTLTAALLYWTVISTAVALTVLLLATPGEAGRSDQTRWPT